MLSCTIHHYTITYANQEGYLYLRCALIIFLLSLLCPLACHPPWQGDWFRPRHGTFAPSKTRDHMMHGDDSLDLRNMGELISLPFITPGLYGMDLFIGMEFWIHIQLGMELETLGIGTRHDAGSMFSLGLGTRFVLGVGFGSTFIRVLDPHSL